MLEIIAAQVLTGLMAKHPAQDEAALCQPAVAIAQRLIQACADAKPAKEDAPPSDEPDAK